MSELAKEIEHALMPIMNRFGYADFFYVGQSNFTSAGDGGIMLYFEGFSLKQHNEKYDFIVTLIVFNWNIVQGEPSIFGFYTENYTLKSEDRVEQVREITEKLKKDCLDMFKEMGKEIQTILDKQN